MSHFSEQEAKAKAEYDQMLRMHLETHNALQYTLGDTLDVKMSIALVLIVFLATETGSLLALPPSAQMPLHWHNALISAIVCLVIASVVAIVSLFPRTYKTGITPTEFEKWASENLRGYTNDCPSNAYENTVEYIKKTQISLMQKRYTHNERINNFKVNLVTVVFIFTSVALFLNVATVSALSWGWRF